MRVELDVKTDIATALAKLAKLEPRQYPFIVALAMNRIMKTIKEAEKKAVQQQLDRPRTNTVNSTYLRPANKNSLSASINIKDFTGKNVPPVKYLEPQIYGGLRKHKRFEQALIRAGIMASDEYAMPANDFPLDAYGNIPGGYITQVLSYLRAFGEQGYRANRVDGAKTKRRFYVVNSTNPRDQRGLPHGIYERSPDGSSRMRIAFVEKPPNYQRRYDFFGIAEANARREFAEELRKASDYAISTSRTNLTSADVAKAIGSLL